MSANDNYLDITPSEDCGKRSDKWKRHEFSGFLTENGVSAALANTVLELCRAEKRPEDPIEFIRERMRPDNEDVAEIRSYHRKIEGLRTRTDELRAERDRLLELKRRIQSNYARQQCDDADDSDTTDDDAFSLRDRNKRFNKHVERSLTKHYAAWINFTAAAGADK
ncbi:hypothetical protein QTP88_025856 [Uroleucon formosanum]